LKGEVWVNTRSEGEAAEACRTVEVGGGDDVVSHAGEGDDGRELQAQRV
jgi:hypothetical protein